MCTLVLRSWPDSELASLEAMRAKKVYTFVTSTLLLEGAEKGTTAGISSQENDFADTTTHPGGKKKKDYGPQRTDFSHGCDKAGSRAADMSKHPLTDQ